MHTAYCPQCGHEICGNDKPFRFSYSHLFLDPNESFKYRIAKSITFDAIQNKSSGSLEFKKNVIQTLKDNEMNISAAAFDNNFQDSGVQNILLNADGSKLGLNFSLNKPEYKQKLVFVTELCSMIQKAVIAKNRLVDYWLSVECDPQNSEKLIEAVKSIPLVRNIANYQLYDTISQCVGKFFTEQENEEYKKYFNAFVKIRNVLKLFEPIAWTVDFDDDDLNTISTEGYITGIQYNGLPFTKRICPNCGAHVSVYLGIYKQKIVSFIGTPTSGKSTVINAIYYKLRKSTLQLSGIAGSIYLHDPFKEEYEENANKMQDKLAVQKTNKGVFPILYTLIENNADPDKKAVYTFVDVPGEYFNPSAKQQMDNTAALRRINVIKEHSDILCIVIAIEQLLGFSPNAEATKDTMAEIEECVLQNFETACGGFFKNNVSCETVLLISKTDAICAENENDTLTVLNGKNKNPTTIPYDIFDKFNAMKRQRDNYYFKNNLIIDESLKQYTDYSKTMMNINRDRWEGVIARIVNFIKPVEDIHIFFISSYGFFAVSDIDSWMSEEKRKALKERFDLSEEQAQEAINIIEKDNLDQKKPASQPAAPVQQTKEANANNNMNNAVNQEVFRVDTVFPPPAAPVPPQEMNAPFPFNDSAGRSNVKTPGRRNKRAPSREETQNISFPPVWESLAYFRPNEQTYENPPTENQAGQPFPPADDFPAADHANDHKETPEPKSIDTQLSAICEDLNRETAKQCFMEAYRKKHHNNNPEGINALIYHFLHHTRFLLSGDDQKEIADLHKKIEYNERCLQEQKECAENPGNTFVSRFIRVFHSNYKSEHEKNIENYKRIIAEYQQQLEKYKF